MHCPSVVHLRASGKVQQRLVQGCSIAEYQRATLSHHEVITHDLQLLELLRGIKHPYTFCKIARVGKNPETMSCQAFTQALV